MGPSWPGRTSGFRRALHPSRARPRAGRPDGTREIRTLRGRDPDECCGSRRGSRIGSDAAGGPNGRAGDRVRSVAPDRRDPSPPPSDLPARLPTVGRAMSRVPSGGRQWHRRGGAGDGRFAAPPLRVLAASPMNRLAASPMNRLASAAGARDDRLRSDRSSGADPTKPARIGAKALRNQPVSADSDRLQDPPRSPRSLPRRPRRECERAIWIFLEKS
jgi:hypothetical protein